MQGLKTRAIQMLFGAAFGTAVALFIKLMWLPHCNTEGLLGIMGMLGGLFGFLGFLLTPGQISRENTPTIAAGLISFFITMVAVCLIVPPLASNASIKPIATICAMAVFGVSVWILKRVFARIMFR